MLQFRQSAIAVDDATNPVLHTVPVTFASNTQNGSLILLLVTSFKMYASSITDSQSNTYVQAIQTTNGGAFADYADIWYAKNITGGTTPTVTVTYTTPDGTSHITTINAVEIRGADLVAPLDQTSGATGSSTSVAPGALTPAREQSLIVSVGHNFTASQDTTVTNQTGYTTINQQLGNGVPYERLYSQYLIQGAPASTNALFTLGASSSWQVSAAVFKSATSKLASTGTG